MPLCSDSVFNICLPTFSRPQGRGFGGLLISHLFTKFNARPHPRFLFFFPRMILQLGQTCVADRNCDTGLHCETCVADGNVRPRCTRVQPISPASQVTFFQPPFLLPPLSFYVGFSRLLWPKIETLGCSSSMSDVGLQVKGLPFNRYSWLTTHNSFALMGQRNALRVLPITPTNQQDSITSQLQVMSLSCLSLSLLSAILSFTAPDLVARRGRKAHKDENIPVRCKHWLLLSEGISSFQQPRRLSEL